MLYFTDGDEVILIASSFGREKHPAWYYNVMAHPEVTLTARGQRGTYVAREIVDPAERREIVDPAERRRLSALANTLYPGYADYEERAGAVGRGIPVLALRTA